MAVVSPTPPCFRVDETLPEEIPEEAGWDSEGAWLLSLLDCSDMGTVFGEYFRPSQKTDVLLVGIEALTADDAHDRQMGGDIVDMAMTDPVSWLTDVPEILRHIHRNVEHIHTEPARRSLHSLLLLLTEWSPREVVRSLLGISPMSDRAAVAMWEVLVSVPWALRRVMSELLGVLQDWRLSRVFSSATEDACIYPLALLACANIDTEEFAALYKAQRYLRRPSPVFLSMVLTGLNTLSKTPEMARKLAVLLPDILETLTDANANVKTKALVLFISVMGHMEREEANLISLSLAEKLLPLFDDECSRVRELSIRLFQDMMKTVVGRNKKKMLKTVQSVLLPLLLHTNEEIESVAKASRDTLHASAKFLGLRRLSSVAKTGQTPLIGECLITHRRSRVEEYLLQSLPYLKDPQATVREEAVRFIGLAARRQSILSQERLWHICDALLPLGKDTEFSIRSLAAKTISVLTIEQSPTSRWSLRSLCCWL
ncbi:maestro heat-like repeat-containing protein family member 7 [Athene noctua]|uniref:maestro heat-like repeat-containing protein family member 7 n=2 Tax=Athene noctua TaxID=126797 RepID=UPI003EB6BBC9